MILNRSKELKMRFKRARYKDLPENVKKDLWNQGFSVQVAQPTADDIKNRRCPKVVVYRRPDPFNVNISVHFEKPEEYLPDMNAHMQCNCESAIMVEQKPYYPISEDL